VSGISSSPSRGVQFPFDVNYEHVQVLLSLSTGVLVSP